ncbi:VWA domain-containing protein, partial [Salmonella sp. s54925]|uniref:VWA domain-containing protein n=1 Tax=Salmonella sp. s54925 TaxID=3159674 RepID=UPI00397F3FA6
VQRNLIFNRWRGARSNAKKAVFVLTDGRSNRGVNPSIPAKSLRRRGVTIFAVGVTKSIRTPELRSMASRPYNKNVFHIDSFSAMARIVAYLIG